jgi:hypothetical protein
MHRNRNEAGLLNSESSAIHPQRPTIDLAKQPIADEVQFFQFPTRIGKTLAGFSNWLPGKEKSFWGRALLHSSNKMLNSIGNFLFRGLGVMTILELLYGFGIGWIFLFFLPTLPWYFAALALTLPPALFLAYSMMRFKPRFSNFFVGTEGFAIYECDAKTKRIDVAAEVRWDEVTDLIIYAADDHREGEFRGRNYKYYWYNRKNGELVHLIGQQRAKGAATPPHLMLAQVCELQWTQELLKNLEHNIKTHGHELFYLRGNFGEYWHPFIRLNHESITLVRDTVEFTYRFEDIAKIYWEGTNLRIQHKNYEKVMFFFRKGNEDEISIEQLCNRRYFLKALEIMLQAKPNRTFFTKELD